MKRSLALLSALLLSSGCSSDSNNQNPEAGAGGDGPTVKRESGGVAGDASIIKTEGGVRTESGVPAGDGLKGDVPTNPPGQPGSVCTQQDKTCAAGLKCVFLDAWNAPKGTCVIAPSGGCSSWDDPRCAVAGLNYSVMCGPYTENGVTTDICFLLCNLNNKTYDCPPLHACKSVNGYDVCLPQ